VSDLSDLRSEHDALSTKLSRFLFVAGAVALLVTLSLSNALQRVDVSEARTKVEQINGLSAETGVAPRVPFVFRSFRSAPEAVAEPDPERLAKQHALEAEVEKLTREAFAVKVELLGLEAPFDLRLAIAVLPVAAWAAIVYVIILAARLRAILTIGGVALGAATDPEPLDRLYFSRRSAYRTVPRGIGVAAAIAGAVAWLVALAFVAADLVRRFDEGSITVAAIALFLITWNVVLAAVAARIRIINDAVALFTSVPPDSLGASLATIVARPVNAIGRAAARFFAPFSFLGGGALVATLVLPVATTKCLDTASGRTMLFRQQDVDWGLTGGAFERELSWLAYAAAIALAVVTIGAAVAATRRALPRSLTAIASHSSALLLALVLYQAAVVFLMIMIAFVLPDEQNQQLSEIPLVLLALAVAAGVLWRRKKFPLRSDLLVVIVAMVPSIVASLALFALMGLWGIPVYVIGLVITTTAWWSYRKAHRPPAA
jgi:hypothetical protein